MTTPGRSAPSPGVEPCSTCPINTWKLLTDPTNTETERSIRRDERRLIARELRAHSKDLAWHVDNSRVTERLKRLLTEAADHIEGTAA